MRSLILAAFVAVGGFFFAHISSAPAAAIIETIAGTGNAEDGGDGGPALATNVGRPFKMQIGPDGGLYFVEYGTHRVRRLDLKSGQITNIAGTGKPGYSGDGGPATKATMNEPHELAIDQAGNMYVTDMRNQVVRKIDAKSSQHQHFRRQRQSRLLWRRRTGHARRNSTDPTVCASTRPATTICCTWPM